MRRSSRRYGASRAVNSVKNTRVCRTLGRVMARRGEMGAEPYLPPLDDLWPLAELPDGSLRL
jgi:hypothetical protein